MQWRFMLYIDTIHEAFQTKIVWLVISFPAGGEFVGRSPGLQVQALGLRVKHAFEFME